MDVSRKPRTVHCCIYLSYHHHTLVIMPAIYSRPSFASTLIEALWRLVRMLFGGGRRVEDAQGGTLAPIKTNCKSPRLPSHHHHLICFSS
jgi:hypothetical protein